MPIFLSLFLLILPVADACTIKPQIQKLFSLSGPVTVILRELNLLNHDKVKGISIFHPVSKKNLKPKIYPGGVFLSQSTLNEFASSVVFFDESRELRHILIKREDINSHEIKTRGLSPMDVVDLVLNQLSPFIVGCEDGYRKVRMKARGIQEELLSLFKDKPYVVFYLGEFRHKRSPELIIVNDGVPKLLIDRYLIQSYPSTLAYVNWSSKLMKGIPAHAIHVGIKDTGMDGKADVVTSAGKMTLYYSGALVPGLSQLEAFLFWAKKRQH